MEFPNFAPSSRNYTDGDWPVKTYKALDGMEVRILYGAKQTGMALSVSYNNLTDAEADTFLDHYRQQKGTFLWFQFPAFDWGPQKGWEGANTAFGVSGRGNKWRYAEAPTITGVYPGISSVSVSLVAVLI